jgi:hypothetical protein
MRLGDDEATAVQHPPDGGGRGNLIADQAEMMPDGGGAGVETGLCQLFAQPDDPVLQFGAGLVRDPVGGLRAGPDRLVASLVETGDELGDPGLGHPVSPSHLPVAAAFTDDSLHHIPSQILHRRLLD